ncbi:MAG: glycoside hydrolase family 13 protein [Actinomycetes bacterium]
MTNSLLPHHDGSDLYVSNSAPKIGEKVEFKVRIPKAYPITGVMIRIYHDGEPRTFDLKIKISTKHENWWSAKVVVMNPATSYRFLLVGKNKYEWLNAGGIFSYEVSSASDFQIFAKPKYPQWINKSVFYQIFPDRFASSGKKRDVPTKFVPRAWNDFPKGRDKTTGIEYFGGDLDGVSEHLDHITALGASGIYFTPFFPANSTHRYDASSFDHVDPLLGGNEALLALANKANKKGIRIMGDLTTNHCGAGHPWIKKALANPSSKEHSYFYWDKSIKHGYEGWWGLASLPKLNYASKALQNAMYEGEASIVRKWLRPPFAMAGWRIDVGNMTGRFRDQDLNQAVMRGIRKAMDEVNPDAWLVAENADHFPADLDGFGWHGTMNYNGFMRPLWGWLQENPEVEGGFFGLPTSLPRFSGGEMVAAMKNFNAGIPWRALLASMLLLNSHDTARFRNVVGGNVDRHFAGMGLLLSYPGVPSIFAGDEIGLRGAWGEDARRTINWEDRSGWDFEFLDRVKKLVAVRRSSDALAYGGLRWVEVNNDYVAFLRESKKETILVVVTRSPADIGIDLAPLGYEVEKNLYGPSARGSSIHFVTTSADVGIWKLK